VSVGQTAASELRIAFTEIGGGFFPGREVNVNCESQAYCPECLNIYVVRHDPKGLFADLASNTQALAAPPRTIILGQAFWAAFDEAWEPLLSWRDEVEDPAFRRAHAQLMTEHYGLFLQWLVAHEAAHLQLGHNTQLSASLATLRTQELAADLAAARLLKKNATQITPQLLGLSNEWMKRLFGENHGRPWRFSDGPAFQSALDGGFISTTWHVTISDYSLRSHPPFVIRILSMLEAAATVAAEQNPRSNWAFQVRAIAKKTQARITVR